MSCEETSPLLVSYHFGEVSPAERGAVEQHLLGCAGCLRDYLDLKREIETAAHDAAPSRAARLRLRAAVQAELAPAPRAWAWWERPLAVVLAGAAVATALFALQLVATQEGSLPRTLDRAPVLQRQAR